MKYKYDFRFTVLLLIVNELLVIILSVAGNILLDNDLSTMMNMILILSLSLMVGTKQLVACNRKKYVEFLDEQCI